MLVKVLKSKIENIRITEANLQYIGSITIDIGLMETVNFIEGEKVGIFNITNGEELYTYIINGERDSGVIGLNGPSSRKRAVGDRIIIASYASIDSEIAGSFKPAVINAADY